MAKQKSSKTGEAKPPRKRRKYVPPEKIQEYDSPWKEIIEIFFRQFMYFFFPSIAVAIDWSRPVEFLDKEFQRTVRRSKGGKQVVDKLVKVWLLTGEEVWILIHIEVQSQRETEFATRMYIYHYRIFDHYRRPILSLAVLADDDPDWRPDRYESQLFGFKELLEFGTVKLLDYEAKWNELEQNPNPFAVVVMAHLKALATKHQDQERLLWKKTLIKMLYQRNYSKEDIFNLFRFIDWVLKLPDALEVQTQLMVDELEEQQNMRYVTSIERLSEEKGKKTGKTEGRSEALRETVIGMLRHRFQPTEDKIQPLILRLEQLTDEATFKQLINLTMDVKSFEDVVQQIAALLPAMPADVPALVASSPDKSVSEAATVLETPSTKPTERPRKPRKPRRVQKNVVTS